MRIPGARAETPGVPRDNNAMESSNNSLKEDGTRREIVGVVPAFRHVSAYIKGRSQNDVEFDAFPAQSKKTWVAAQELVASNVFTETFCRQHSGGAVVLSATSRDAVKRAATATQNRRMAMGFVSRYSDVAENGGQAEVLRGKSLDEALAIVGSAYHLRKLRNVARDNPVKYQCSCPDFWHYWQCKHALGLAISRGEVSVPPRYVIASLRGRQSKGRPAAARGGDALKAQATRAFSQSQK